MTLDAMGRLPASNAENDRLLEALQHEGRSSSIPHVITGEDRRILFANAPFESLCGYSVPDVMGRNPGELLQGPESNEAVVGAVRRLLREPCSFEFHLVNYHRAGHPYRTGVIIFPFRCEGQLYFLGVQREIDEDEDLLAEPHFEDALLRAATLIDGHDGVVGDH